MTRRPTRAALAIALLLGLAGITRAQNVPDARFGNQNAATQPSEGNPIIPGLFADPSIAKFGDTFYLYTTTDGFGWQTGRWVTWTSTDLVHWSFHGESFPEITGQSNWAPGKPIQRAGKYYLPFTLGGNSGQIAVADQPQGPFRFAFDRGNPLVNTIDMELFVDDDGTPYAIYGGTHIYLQKLKPDLSAFDGPKLELDYHKGYVEGPFLFKRNGVYYACAANLGYADYRMIYARADHVGGPYTFPNDNVILAPDPAQHIWGVGHGNVFNVGDDYYVVYLRSRMGEVGVDPFQTAGNVYRQICIDRLYFDADGNIRQTKPSRDGVALIGPSTERGTNVAIGKTATASSSLEGYGPEKAIDGSFGTRWVVGTGEPIVMTAEHAKVSWAYTFDRPPENWASPGFDSTAWQHGFGGFGTMGTPGAIIGTEWRSKDIWLRRQITLSQEQLDQILKLRVHHDDAADIYLNGILAAHLNGFENHYSAVPIRPEALVKLHAGQNILAIHATQDRGGQYIDVGLTAGEREPFWQIDLGAATRVERTEISFNYPTELTPCLLEWSADGQDWKPYGDHLNDAVRESPKIDTHSVMARYFRIRFAEPVHEQIPAGVWEFKAFDQP